MTTSIIYNTLVEGNVGSAITMLNGTKMYDNPEYQKLKSLYNQGSITQEDFCRLAKGLFQKEFPNHVKQL